MTPLQILLICTPHRKLARIPDTYHARLIRQARSYGPTSFGQSTATPALINGHKYLAARVSPQTLLPRCLRLYQGRLAINHRSQLSTAHQLRQSLQILFHGAVNHDQNHPVPREGHVLNHRPQESRNLWYGADDHARRGKHPVEVVPLLVLRSGVQDDVIWLSGRV